MKSCILVTVQWLDEWYWHYVAKSLIQPWMHEEVDAFQQLQLSAAL